MIELTDKDEVQIDNELLSNTSITNSQQLTINSGSYSQDSEILLMTSDCINSELQDILTRLLIHIETRSISWQNVSHTYIHMGEVVSIIQKQIQII